MDEKKTYKGNEAAGNYPHTISFIKFIFCGTDKILVFFVLFYFLKSYRTYHMVVSNNNRMLFSKCQLE